MIKGLTKFVSPFICSLNYLFLKAVTGAVFVCFNSIPLTAQPFLTVRISGKSIVTTILTAFYNATLFCGGLGGCGRLRTTVGCILVLLFRFECRSHKACQCIIHDVNKSADDRNEVEGWYRDKSIHNFRFSQ